MEKVEWKERVQLQCYLQVVEMEIYFIQHCQLILQDSLLITIVSSQGKILVSSLDKDGIVLTDLGSL